jgi:hypothetical protein
MKTKEIKNKIIDFTFSKNQFMDKVRVDIQEEKPIFFLTENLVVPKKGLKLNLFIKFFNLTN